MVTAGSMDFESWEDRVCRVCGPLDAYPAMEQPFLGTVDLRRVADVALIEHHASVERMFWDQRHIAEIQLPYCYVLLQLASRRLMIEQNGNDVTLNMGDWTIVDSLRPAKFSFEGNFNILAVNIPRNLVVDGKNVGDLPLARLMSGTSGASAIFSSYARSLFSHAPSLHPDDLRYRENLLDLMFSSLPENFDQLDRRRERVLERAKRVIEANLLRPDLSPQWIADALGISVRHLHRLFANEVQSVNGWVRQRRLERARCDLGDRRFIGNSITEIAYGLGFSDSAHFSRAFRAAFGISPSHYRRQVLSVI